MRSPFRYPGAKSKLTQAFFDIVDLSKYDNFVDVFCGGGSVFLGAADKNANLKIHINDKDDLMFSYWNTLFSSKIHELNNTVRRVKPSIYEFKKRRRTMPKTEVQRAFNALFFNRTTFSGCYDSGPIGGYEQLGNYKIDCRWNPESIIERNLEIKRLLIDRIKVHNLDFSEALKINLEGKSVFYLDPPYFEAGSQLYRTTFGLDHHYGLCNILRGVASDWFLSYDNNEEIKKMYDWCDVIELSTYHSFKNKNKTINELLIFPKYMCINYTPKQEAVNG